MNLGASILMFRSLSTLEKILRVEFDLTVSRGNTELILCAKLCAKNNTDECLEGIEFDSFNAEGSTFEKA